MIAVLLGNSRAVARQADGTRIPVGTAITTCGIPGGYTMPEKIRSIVHEQDGLWPVHSDDARPAWVESDDADLARAISDHYGCPIGRPDDWKASA